MTAILYTHTPSGTFGQTGVGHHAYAGPERLIAEWPATVEGAAQALTELESTHGVWEITLCSGQTGRPIGAATPETLLAALSRGPRDDFLALRGYQTGLRSLRLGDPEVLEGPSVQVDPVNLRYQRAVLAG